MKPEIRILLADDHTLVRSGFRALLDAMHGVEVVGEASDGRQVLRLVEQLSPHLVLMDIAMPELNGLGATERIRREFPHVKVLILSMYSGEEYVAQALAVGAHAYMLKDSGATELRLAVDAVMRGDSFLSPAVAKRIMAGNMNLQERGAALGLLTPRQTEILQLIAEGATTKEIAGKLDVSIKTVESHRANLMERLDIHDIAGLVRYALRHGVIRAD